MECLLASLSFQFSANPVHLFIEERIVKLDPDRGWFNGVLISRCGKEGNKAERRSWLDEEDRRAEPESWKDQWCEFFEQSPEEVRQRLDGE
jgi:hypothetical protein